MAPIGTLWGASRQPQTKIILSVAALNDLELEQPAWDFSNKPAAFTSKFTYGKIPAFEGADGLQLIEGTTIARYLSSLGTKVNLLGSDTKEKVLVDQWVHFVEQELGGPITNTMGLIFGHGGPFSREHLDKQAERLHRGLTHVESHLATRPSGYLVSNSVTLADLVLAGIIHASSYAALGAAERAKYPAIFAHHAKVTANEKIKQLWGTGEFTEVRITEPKTRP